MKHPRRSLADRVVPFVAIYLCGAATSAGLMIAGEDSPVELAEAAPLPSLARRVEASREEPMPAPRVDGPAPLQVPAVVFSLEHPPAGRPAPLVLDESSRIETDLSGSGVVVPFASFEASTDREVGSAPRPERTVAAMAPRRPAAPRLEAAQIRSAIATNMPTIRRCYERVGRRQGEGREERLQVELRITRGEVRSASVSGASNPLLEQCVSTAVRGWRFPEGSAEVSLPVRLRPREG